MEFRHALIYPYGNFRNIFANKHVTKLKATDITVLRSWDAFQCYGIGILTYNRF